MRALQADTHERFYGFVTAVDKDKAAITAGLQPKTNETKTMGTRHTGPARAAGEGMYRRPILIQALALTQTLNLILTRKPQRESHTTSHRTWLPQAPRTLCTLLCG